MSQLVVLKLGRGNWQTGLPNVVAQIWEAGSASATQFTGSLPPAPELLEVYGQWRSLYTALSHRLSLRRSAARSLIEIEDEGVTHVSTAAFQELCQQLKREVNRWLDSGSFGKVERRLRTRLLPAAEVRLIVETDDRQLRQFPWHLWSFFEDYPHAEVALSTPEYRHVSPPHPISRDQVRILAVLGNSQGIDVQHDRALLEQLPATATVFLVEPQRLELDRHLWDEQGWDILFFAGHSTSQTDGSSGEIAINQTSSLTINQLKNALKAAIDRGLKLAIFNSCDGLGLARAMADLNIPQLVVMREPVPDPVAQEFLKHLLTAFASGQSFYQSVRQAREKLQGLEDQFPCASWLPVICQNPAEVPLDWHKLGHANSSAAQTVVQNPVVPQVANHPIPVGVVASLAVTSLVMAVRLLGGLQSLELQAFDHLMRLRPGESADPHILVVEVTQEDTNQYGYPLEDATLAQLIQTLEQLQPRAIGLDMHRYQPRGQGRASLMAQFQQHPNLFTVCGFGSTDRNFAPPPEFSETQRNSQLGFSNLLLDGSMALSSSRDDVSNGEESARAGDSVRRQLLSYDPSLAGSPSACSTPYSFGFQLAYRFLAQAKIQPLQVNQQGNWQFGSVTLQKLPSRFGGYQQLDGMSSQILINYRSSPPGQRVTLKQVLQGQINRSSVENRVVLIGTTAPIARDSFETPYGEMPGTWIHAHMVSQLLSAVMHQRPLIWSLPQWQGVQWGDALWVLAWSAIGSLLAWRVRSWLWLGCATVAAVLVLHQLCLLVLVQGGWLPLVPAGLALVLTGSGSTQAFRRFFLRRQK